MANACGVSGAGCSAGPGYYNGLADELADSVVFDQLVSHGFIGANCWPFENPANGTLGQKEPTLDHDGILSEMCIPSTQQSDWPDDCPVGTDSSSFQSYLIAKGIFQRALYCVQSKVTDTTLANFAQTNAVSLAGTLTHYGFYWDDSGANNPVNFATRASILEGLDADLGQQEADAGQPHYGMC